MKLKLLVLILSLNFVACSIPKPRPDIYGIESGTAIVALVLGEGIARSYAHVGVIKALEEEKIPIHMVVGSGMGGLMGAMTAFMLINDHLRATSVIVFAISAMIIAGLHYMIYFEMRETERQRKDDHFMTVVITFILMALTTWLIVFGPRTGIFV